MQQVKYVANASNFSKIPGSPIAYWVSRKMSDIFYNKSVQDYADVKTGMSTGDNDKYLRLWTEVSIQKISLYSSEMDQINLGHTPWIPYNKGGDARKWYGNNEYVVKWSEYKHFHRPRLSYNELFLKEGLTWSFVTSGMFSARYYRKGFLWDVAGSPCVVKDRKNLKYIVGLFSTKIVSIVLKLINPTLNCQVIDIQRVPVIIDFERRDNIVNLSDVSIEISVRDWDSFETSWDFKKHPLI